MHTRDCAPTAADGISPRPPFAWPSPKNVWFFTAVNTTGQDRALGHVVCLFHAVGACDSASPLSSIPRHDMALVSGSASRALWVATVGFAPDRPIMTSSDEKTVRLTCLRRLL
jgi:hypothetical protein